MKRLGLLFLSLLAGWTPRAAGQHFLAVKEGEKLSVVVAAKGTFPLVRNDGKLEGLRATQFVLRDGGEYLPLFVAIRNLQVKNSSRVMQGIHLNKEFHVRCELETAYSLDDVFVVFVVKNDTGDSNLFLFEVGHLEPREPKLLSLMVPMEMRNGEGRFHLYLFSGGRELFNSKMSPRLVESALDRLVQAQLKGVVDAPAAPLVGPQQEYPAALHGKRIDGSATLSFLISARGIISNPSVVNASQPEFGAAALEVISQWRFLPKVEMGHPVESQARMPFEFTAPK
jgi:TonB family protein